MKLTRSELADVWSVLEGLATDPAEIKVKGVGLGTAQGEVRLGRDGSGRLHLLVPIGLEEPLNEDKRSSGVHILKVVLLEEGNEVAFGDVVCLLPHLADIFHRLAAEMVEAIDDNPESPLPACRAVLDQWRELLDRAGSKFSRNALAGLYGELWHLRLLLEEDPARRLDVWRGCRGEIIDFRRGSSFLEVKVSFRREGRVIEIHGLRQLERPEGTDLFLSYLGVEESPRGESVPDLIEAIKGLGASSGEFTELLQAVGYEESDADQFEAVRFSVLEHRLYEVDDDFPRITPELFFGGEQPAGIVDVNYWIDLTNEPPIPLAASAALELFKRMAGEGA
ncbi:MAG: PD-(D/E)XK motif protein [Actinobacteria bacterium]|nr:PD-(D/E)XK motif protein [Actinomycetota bacterium]